MEASEAGVSKSFSDEFYLFNISVYTLRLSKKLNFEYSSNLK